MGGQHLPISSSFVSVSVEIRLSLCREMSSVTRLWVLSPEVRHRATAGAGRLDAQQFLANLAHLPGGVVDST